MSVTEGMLSSLLDASRRSSQVPFRVYIDQELLRARAGAHLPRTDLEFPCTRKCEIPNLGDYKTTYVGDAPVIVVRGQEGVVNALVNRCAHKGALIC